MIRRTLQQTEAATFCVLFPNPQSHGMPAPVGTGFFVSPEGWFVTAAHVVTENGQPEGPARSFKDCLFQKEMRLGGLPILCQSVTLSHIDPASDFALLKVDFQAHATHAWLKDRSGFPFMRVSKRELEVGEPVYSFGYPLSSSEAWQVPGAIVSTVALNPRLTSAIVSSALETTRMVMTSRDIKVYVLDRALNYGNSGGPIVAAQTGNVHALCSRFQPMQVPQPQLEDPQGNLQWIVIPSLYGIVSSLANPSVLAKLQSVGVEVVDQ